MPAIVIAVAAAAAGAAASGVIAGALTGAVIAGVTVSATAAIAIGAIAGGVVAVGVSYAGSSALGLNKPAKQAAQGASAPQGQGGRDRRQMFRNAIAARQVIYGTARVSGPMIYASSSGADLEYLHIVIPLAGHPIAGWNAIWVNDVRVTPDQMDGSGQVTTGALVAADGVSCARLRVYDGRQSAADPDLVLESTDGWGGQCVGFGVAYLYARLRYDDEVFRSGIQNLSVEVRGRADIYDPRSGATGYSDNPALCVLDYLRSDFGLACDDDEIDEAYFVTAANVCDEAVQIDDAGNTQSRYVIGGAFTLDRDPLNIIEDLKQPAGGELVYVQGRYRFFAAAYEPPSDTLTVSDLAGPVSVSTMPARRDLFNSVRGTYIEPGRDWQPSEFAPVSDIAFTTADRETIWRDVDMPMVTDQIRAQRLAYMGLLRARESLTAQAQVRYAGLRYSVWQVLSVTVDQLGWAAKAFRISAWSYNPATGIVTLELREESAAAYAWQWDQARSLGLAPNTSLVSPFAIPAPAGLTVTEQLYVTNSGASVRTRAALAWLRPAHPFIIGYDVQSRLIGTTDWLSSTGTTGETAANVDDLADGRYEFRVRARNSVASGTWATVAASLGGLLAVPPSDVTGLAVQSIGGFAYLRWDEHPDLDVRIGGRIEFRHTPDTGSPTWVGSTSIGDAVPGSATLTMLPLKAGSYLAKAVDQGGRYSANAVVIGSAQATALAWSSLSTVTDHSTFSGTKTDTVVTASTLRLDTNGDVDAEADFDAIADLDRLGVIKAEGSYTFATGMDLTSVKSVRLTATIAAAVENTFDMIDARGDSVDAWLSWDGEVGGEADAWIEVRETPDNPGGSPTWSAWRRLDAAEFRNRAFQFRAQLRSYDPAFNIHISELSAKAEEVA